MSKIWDMLKKEKVEWKRLGEVCDIKRGRVISKKYLEEHKGDYPVYSSQTMNNGEIGKIDTFDFDGEYVTWTTDGAYAGTVFYRNGKFSITNICGLISPKASSKLLVKFIVYWLKIEAQKHVKDGSGNPKLMSNVVEKIKIPIPSLATQKKIVDILDKFTECTTNLCRELNKELELRIKQYEYYRAMLLSEEYMKQLRERFLDKNSDLVCKVRLSTVATYSNKKISAEKVNSKTYIGVDNLLKDKGGKVDCNHLPNSGTLNAFTQNDILIGNIRPYLRKIWLADIDGGTNGDVLTICIKNEFKNKLLPKFLYQTLSSEEFFYYNIKFSKGAKMPRGDKNKIMEYEFFLPPLQVQEHIVTILDKFHTIVHDLKIGLPREIELRQQQYEYYRDKLLSFDSCEC